MSTIDSYLAAEHEQISPFLDGHAKVTGQFWLVNLLRFSPDGRAEYLKYVEGMKPAMAAVGARPVFQSFTCRTVTDGAGEVMEVDGVFVGEYPSPGALIEMNKSEVYKTAHHHRTAALAETAMYAIPCGWLADGNPVLQRQPDPSTRAPEVSKSGKRLEAVNGEPKRFMEFVSDERFGGDGPIWMLNFLQFEPTPGQTLYDEYAVRAQSEIGRMQGKSGGLLWAEAVHTLKGPRFDNVGIMCYPSRDAFLQYVTASLPHSARKKAGDGLMAEGFRLRRAGLALQGLVCMVPSPDAVWDADDRSTLSTRL
jgi:uncharacterized protein (DUF1330 family)